MVKQRNTMEPKHKNSFDKLFANNNVITMLIIVAQNSHKSFETSFFLTRRESISNFANARFFTIKNESRSFLKYICLFIFFTNY